MSGEATGTFEGETIWTPGKSRRRWTCVIVSDWRGCWIVDVT